MATRATRTTALATVCTLVGCANLLDLQDRTLAEHPTAGASGKNMSGTVDVGGAASTKGGSQGS